MEKISQNYRVLTPAYGRDYKSQKAVEADFRKGMDFMLQPENRPCSIRDFQPGVMVSLRYQKLTKVFPVGV